MRDSETNLRLAECALCRGARFAFDRNLTSFDPRDTLMRIPAMVWATTHPTVVGWAVRRLGGLLNAEFPYLLRKLYGVRPNCEHQSLMLAIELCIHLARIEGESWALRIDPLLSRLMAAAITDERGMGWGSCNPFYVREPGGNVIFVTATSRIVHSTLLAANVLLSLALRFGNKKALDAVPKVAEFLSSGVFRTDMPSGALAFAYTDLDHCQIINVSAETASFLVRAGRVFGRDDWIKTGMGGAKFILESMRSDGSWGYETAASSAEDNCHTVMNLKSLLEILEQNASSQIDVVEQCAPQIHDVIDRGLRHYLDTFFREDGMVKSLPASRSSERTYDSAYAIRLLTAVVNSSLFCEIQHVECDTLLEHVVEYSLAHNQREDGEFILQRRGGTTFWFPNMRHGQLQMCIALAEYCGLRRAQATEFN